MSKFEESSCRNLDDPWSSFSVHMILLRFTYTRLFTRHSNVECFESAVPVNFGSYAPTFLYNFKLECRVCSAMGFTIAVHSNVAWNPKEIDYFSCLEARK